MRLDVALVDQGLEASRERARRLVQAGEVTVNGVVARAPSTLVPVDATLAIGKRLAYVSRGGLKLAHALDRFGLDVAGKVALDAGASTGGFTDCLLQRGARRVYAVDVGKGQLAWSLRQDPRVVVMEQVNVRYLRPASADTPQGLPEAVDVATIDVAFISLRLVLPAIAGVIGTGVIGTGVIGTGVIGTGGGSRMPLPESTTAGAPAETQPGITPRRGDVIALVKPQFEAGQSDVGKGGVVRDPRVHRRVLEGALQAARQAGLTPAGLTASPIRGEAGNVEFLLWARAGAGDQADAAFLADGPAIEAALAEAAALVPGRPRG